MKGLNLTILIILVISSVLFATDKLTVHWYHDWNGGDEIVYPLDVSMDSGGSSKVTYKGVVKIGNNPVEPDSAVISHSGCEFKYTGGNETLECGLATVKETAGFINANNLPNDNAKARMRVSYTGYLDAYTSIDFAHEVKYKESYTVEEGN